MDLSSCEGFCNAMWSVARLRPGGGHLTAPVCSTFVIVYLGVFMFLEFSNCLFVLCVDSGMDAQTNMRMFVTKKVNRTILW